MRGPLRCLFAALMMAFLSPAAASAQCSIAAADTMSPPAVRLIAYVRASELRLDARPRAEVRGSGCITGDTLRILTRRNLPDTITPGEIYRDIEIAVEIVTRFSVVCSAELLNLLASSAAAPRLAALCAASDTSAPRRQR